MDTWFFLDVTHRLHAHCNPISDATVRELEAVLELGPRSRVLDVACGHAEMLVSFAHRHGCRGVGVDISPFAIRRAERLRSERLRREQDVELVNASAETWSPGGGEPFDVACCVGASWIWHGYAGTLRALAGFVRAGGLVVLGEPCWRAEPAPEYLRAASLRRDELTTLSGLRDEAWRQRLALVWMRSSSQQEWDRYEMLRVAALDRFEREEPDHADLPAMRARVAAEADAYLRWGRQCLGFATWVFRTPAAAEGVA